MAGEAERNAYDRDDTAERKKNDLRGATEKFPLLVRVGGVYPMVQQEVRHLPQD